MGWDIIQNVQVFMRSTRHSWPILIELEFSPQFFLNTQISSFIKIRLVGAELFHADGRMDRHTEA
jgi:hypothetical protein